MSSLGVSLLLLVVLAVAVAVVYNLRQSSSRLQWPAGLRLPQVLQRLAGKRGGEGVAAKPAPRAASPAASPDRLAPRGEPRLAGTHAAAQAPSPGVEDTAADLQRAGSPGAVPAPVPPAAAQSGAADTIAGSGPARASRGEVRADTSLQPLLSEVCDCIVEIGLPSPCPGERALALAQRFRRAGAKPVAVEGRESGAPAEAWGALAATRQYEALRIGVLMANRHGALNAMEYSEFVAGVQAIAEALSSLADTPDMAAVLARARDLDATCAQLDAQIGLNVEAPEALGPAQLAALAGELSVVERGSDRYARLGARGEVVFSVALGDVPTRLTFLLDVPRSTPDSDAWNAMLGAAGACAQRLGGRLVDDAGRPLADAALAQIGRQLVQRYESLEAIGVPAGSALALRVFN